MDGGKCGVKDGAQKAAGAASELGLANVGGVFVVLAGGSAIAIFICISEFIWKMKQIPRTERDHIAVELMRELKHVICCYGSTRPVRRTLDDLACPVQPVDHIEQMNRMNGMAFIPGYNDFVPSIAGSTGKYPFSTRQHPPPLTTDSSTQSNDPLLERQSSYPSDHPMIHQVNNGIHDSIEDNEEETDSDGGFKSANNPEGPPNPANFYPRFPGQDVIN